MNYKIVNTLEFQKEIKHLSKKYPSLHDDFEIFLNQLSKNPFQGTSLGNNFYKVRLAISSKGKGKSGGARVITYLRIAAETVLLISIYDKSEKSTITEKEIKERLKRFPA
ncbi:MAG: type II toxin-antitoxin system RelE/ParE family toxin [Ginsengibacter sp.]